jgi:hypothetical protein
MKRLLILCLGLFAVLSLAACGGESAAEPAMSQSVSTVDPAEVDSTDLTLVGKTGRPQFLNSFATW